MQLDRSRAMPESKSRGSSSAARGADAKAAFNFGNIRFLRAKDSEARQRDCLIYLATCLSTYSLMPSPDKWLWQIIPCQVPWAFDVPHQGRELDLLSFDHAVSLQSWWTVNLTEGAGKVKPQMLRVTHALLTPQRTISLPDTPIPS